jgi:hypothetical protein
MKEGILLLEEVERDIQGFGEHPPLNPLIEPLRITSIDTSHIKEELNGSQTILLEETVDQQNPNPMSP